MQQKLLNYLPKYGTFLPEIKVSTNVFLSLDHKVKEVLLGGLLTNIIEMLFTMSLKNRDKQVHVSKCIRRQVIYFTPSDVFEDYN